MRPKKHGSNTWMLGGSLALAGLYFGLLVARSSQGLAVSSRLGGVVGIVLGLFMCSHPAANALNLLLFHQGAAFLGFSRPAYRWWWVLNLMVFLTSLGVIFSGTLQFLAH
jgi:hypothetical protein